MNLPQFIQEKREEFDKKFTYPKGHTMHEILRSGIRREDIEIFFESCLTQLVEKMEDELKHESLKDECKKDASTCPVHMREVRGAHNYGLKVGFRAVLRRIHLFKTGEEHTGV